MSVSNGRVIFSEPPATIIVPGTHLKYETAPLDIESIPLNGGVLAKTILISPDPYMRGKLRASGAGTFELGKPLTGFGVAKIIRSDNPAYSKGDLVESMGISWENYAVYPSSVALNKVTPLDGVPLSAWIGTLGMPGMTAYYGLSKLGEVKQGDTVFVTAAAGAVGSLVVQLAKLSGAKVIASAGSDDKVKFLKETLGADVAFNYKKENTADVLAAHGGFDVYFDNVSGEILDVALANAKPGARVLLCGMISNYTRGEPYGNKNLAEIFRRELKVLGVNVFRLIARNGNQEAIDFLAPHIKSGKIKVVEHKVEGLDNAPGALAELLTGGNLGKSIVYVAETD